MSMPTYSIMVIVNKGAYLQHMLVYTHKIFLAFICAKVQLNMTFSKTLFSRLRDMGRQGLITNGANFQ